MEDILIAGYSLKELQKQHKEIQQDANKIISDNLEKVAAIVHEIDQLYQAAEEQKSLCEDGDKFVAIPVDKIQIKSLSDKAVGLLKQTQDVASVANIEYCLAYDTEYNSDEVLSCQINNSDWFEWATNNPLNSLLDVLEGMEYQSRQWHASNC